MTLSPMEARIRQQKKADRKKQQEAAEVKTPSRFGSHESMSIFADVGNTGFVHNYVYWLLLRDNRGVYATDRARMDTGLVDPHRTAPTELREDRVQDLLSTENWNSLEEYLAYYGDWGPTPYEEHEG